MEDVEAAENAYRNGTGSYEDYLELWYKLNSEWRVLDTFNGEFIWIKYSPNEGWERVVNRFPFRYGYPIEDFRKEGVLGS